MATQLKLRKFLPAKTTGSIRKDPNAALTTSINRLGFVVSDIGSIMQGWFDTKLAIIEDQKDRANLAADKAREDKLEKDVQDEVAEEAEKSGVAKKSQTWIQKLLSPFMWIGSVVAKWAILTFLSNPDNENFIKNTIPVIKTWLGTFFKVTMTGVNWIMDAFAEDSIIMGALKLIGGIGALTLASRILQPWKLIGDAARFKKFLDAAGAAGNKRFPKTMERGRRFRRNLGRRMKVRSGRLVQGTRRTLATGGRRVMGGLNKFGARGGFSAVAGLSSFAGRLNAGDSVQKAAGGGIGATIGGVALTAFLTPILGPFAPLVGNLIGGFIGDKIGAFLGEAMTPIFAPLKRYFVEIMFPVLKSLFEPLAGPITEFFGALMPVIQQIVDFLKPIFDSAVKKLTEWLNSEEMKVAIDRLVGFLKMAWEIAKKIGGAVKKLASSAVDTITKFNPWASAIQKQKVWIKDSEKQTAALKKEFEYLKERRQERLNKGEELDKVNKSRFWWPGVDGFWPWTPGGMPGLAIRGSWGEGWGTTLEKKINHWPKMIKKSEEKWAERKKELEELKKDEVEKQKTKQSEGKSAGGQVTIKPAPPGDKETVKRWLFGMMDGMTMGLTDFDGRGSTLDGAKNILTSVRGQINSELKDRSEQAASDDLTDVCIKTRIIMQPVVRDVIRTVRGGQNIQVVHKTHSAEVSS